MEDVIIRRRRAGVRPARVPEIANETGEDAKTHIRPTGALHHFIIDGKQSLSKSLISFKQAVADFYIFPAGSCTAPSPFAARTSRGRGRSMRMSSMQTAKRLANGARAFPSHAARGRIALSSSPILRRCSSKS